MIINNIIFNCELEDILEKLKFELGKRGVELLSIQKESGDNIQIQCPYHSYGKEQHPSAGIHKETGVFSCFTCKEAKTLPNLITDLLHEDGWKWLLSNFSSMSILSRDNFEIDIDRTKTKKQVKYLDKSELNKYRYYHDYLNSRKIPLEIARRYDLGYDKEKDCITFPIFDYKGNLLYFATRSVKGKRFHYPTGTNKPVYGIYQLNRDYPNCKEVIICESMINALTCLSYGKPAIALNGTGTKEQLTDLINFPYRHYILALDPDDAGDNGTKKLINALRGKKLLSRYVIPKGKDINDLSKEEFNSLELIDIM